MELFKPVISDEKQHKIFKTLMQSENKPERVVLLNWANGFKDRDNKFIQEFQSTFESSMWELYIYAVLKEIGIAVDMDNQSPDFFCSNNEHKFCIEATIAAPEKDGIPPYGDGLPVIMPNGLDEFNRDAIVRICNSISSKHTKYDDTYSKLNHISNKPFVLALAPFNQPGSHFSTNVPILAALYGVYNCESLSTIFNVDNPICIKINAIKKRNGVVIPLGYFESREYDEISAILYNPLTTWGKIRALANNKDKQLQFETMHHPGNGGVKPVQKTLANENYSEHVLDGLYIFHNPHAKHPLPLEIFKNKHVAQYYWDNSGFKADIPENFLLSRWVNNCSLYK
ncbi:hypothetical protein Lmor_2796 [Legionella moravica]|uniref:Glycosaminoglycan attachment site n=1 Tax=Legionella moravica TaxID=39962 RepID=A0A378JT21_9GAMM|nr:hypothetical protein [Legionella moravica]KTD31189.1 hypothetical protein Lmor_2796 [Legionella moravica]STX61167.1 Uncharacterised protein [Legionella moravica]